MRERKRRKREREREEIERGKRIKRVREGERRKRGTARVCPTHSSILSLSPIFYLPLTS